MYLSRSAHWVKISSFLYKCLFQNHPQRFKKVVSQYSDNASLEKQKKNVGSLIPALAYKYIGLYSVRIL